MDTRSRGREKTSNGFQMLKHEEALLYLQGKERRDKDKIRSKNLIEKIRIRSKNLISGAH